MSGLLYKRNLLLYDRETESLWAQLLGKSATGALAGTRLRLLTARQVSWAAWKLQHPDSKVLSIHTGYRRDYQSDPYRDLPLARSLALVVAINGQVRIYPFSELKKADGRADDRIADAQIRIIFDAHRQEADARTRDGAAVPSFVAFVADARAFYPDAPVFKANRK